MCIRDRSKGNMLRGIFAGCLGVMVSLVGVFSDNNMVRMVPGPFTISLRNGFSLLPVIIGPVSYTHLED